MDGPRPMQPGEMLGGRYRVVRELGSGGMGTVYEGLQTDLGRRVAIKLVRVDGPMGEMQERRFEREARAGARLSHPNIVQVTDFGVDEGRPFLVMELLHGEPMRALLRREGTLSPEAALDVVGPILAALAYAHGEGIVHRDVKPDNVFLVPTEHGTVSKLVDFGIARDASDESPPLTGTHHTLGTAAYMAPEQVRAARSVGAPADQYAVGVMLFEAFTGVLPHEGPPIAAAAAKLAEAAPPLASLRPDLPPALAKVVDRALAMDPGARFENASAMLDALVAAVEGRDEPTSAHANTIPAGASSLASDGTLPPPSTGDSLDAAEPRPRSSVPTPAAPDRIAPRPRRYGGLLTGALVAALAGFGLLGAWALDRPADPSAPVVAEAEPESGTAAPPPVEATTGSRMGPSPMGNPIAPLPTAPVDEEATIPIAVPLPAHRRAATREVVPAPAAAATRATITALHATGYTEWTARAHVESVRRGVDRCVAASSPSPGLRSYEVEVDEAGHPTRVARATGPAEPSLDGCVTTALRHAGWSPPMGAGRVEVTYRLE